MKKSELQSATYDAIDDVLVGTGFRLKKNEEGFIRTIPSGRQALLVPLVDFAPRFEFSLTACIRIDAVEEILHRFSGAPSKYHPLSYTTITQLEYFTGQNSVGYTVMTLEDVSAAIDELRPTILSRMIPTFEEYQDVKSLNQVLNSQRSSKVPFDSSQSPWGPISAVIVARLASNPDYGALVRRFRNELKIGNDPNHPLNQVVEYLDMQ